jgi:tyrosine-protein kinase Etk/Wzc
METGSNIRQIEAIGKPKLEISYRKVLQVLLSRWQWVVYTTCIALLFAYISLLYTAPSFSTRATLKFEEKRSEISELMNVRSVYDRSDKLLSEQFVIRSREVLLNALINLDYPISFFEAGLIRETDLYPQTPLQINISANEQLKHSPKTFKFLAKTKTAFTLQYEEGGSYGSHNYKIGDVISVDGLTFKVVSFSYPSESKAAIIFHFNTPEELLSRVDAGLKMNENKNTNILTFNQIDQNATFARDILNSILNEYQQYDRRQKTESATQTIDFISQLQAQMADVVKKSGSNFEQFKVQSQMLDISGTTKKVTAQLETFEKEKSNIELERLMISQLEKDVLDNKNSNAINYNLQGIADPLLTALLSQYNLLLMKKQQELLTFKASSSSVQELDSQLLQVKLSIKSNIAAQLKKNKEASVFLDQQTDQIAGTFNRIPKTEKNFINLQSAFDINQKVFAYLSEKKLEAQISKASITRSVIIVDRATINNVPIVPIPQTRITTAAVIGIISGLGLIFLVRLINPFIRDVEGISSLTKTPVVGIIRKLPGKHPKRMPSVLPASMILEDSAFYESVRAVRTSVSYIAPEKTCKVICITSEVSNEGKSFTAVHLAKTLCLIDKRVLVIAADLRKSTLHQTFNLSNDVGLSSFLNGTANTEQIVLSTGDANLDFVSAGPTPVNPSELIHSFRMKDLIGALRTRYDYIVIDCAPVGLVSDAIPLIKCSDINLFIIRAGVSRQTAALIPEALSREFELTNLFIILNSFENETLYSSYYKGLNQPSGYYNAYLKPQYYNEQYRLKDTPKRSWKFWKN